MRRLVQRAILAALVAGAIARVHAPAGIDEDASFRCAKRRGLIGGHQPGYSRMFRMYKSMLI